MREPLCSQPLRALMQDSFELAFNAAPAKPSGAFARDHDDIASGPQQAAAPAKKLAYLPLDPIARHRIAYFAADRNPQSGLGTVVGPADNDKIRRMKFLTEARKVEKFRSFS